MMTRLQHTHNLLVLTTMAEHKTFSSTFHKLLPAAQVERYTSTHAALPVIASFGFQIHRSVQNNVWPYIDMSWQSNVRIFVLTITF